MGLHDLWFPGRSKKDRRNAAGKEPGCLEGMYSLYRWNGAMQEDQETLLIAKTRHALVNELTEAVLSIHSYDCPCIIELPIQQGNPEFLQWIVSETEGLSKN